MPTKILDEGTTEGGKEEERDGIHVDRTTVTTVKELSLFLVCKVLISGDQTSRSEMGGRCSSYTGTQKQPQSGSGHQLMLGNTVDLSCVFALNSFGKGMLVDKTVKLGGIQVEMDGMQVAGPGLPRSLLGITHLGLCKKRALYSHFQRLL